jgi:hypothetical protein
METVCMAKMGTEKRTNKSTRQEVQVDASWLVKQIIQRKMNYFVHINGHEGSEKRWKGIYQEGGRGGGQKRDEFRISQTICK